MSMIRELRAVVRPALRKNTMSYDYGPTRSAGAGTSAVVGLFPTRGLVSIAGIAPLDWLLDNTGPIARNVTDVAIALGVMAGEDPLDFKTAGSEAKAQGRA